MNRKQTMVMWIGIIAFVLMGLYPPWIVEGGMAKITLHFGPQYSYILTPPKGPDTIGKIKDASKMFTPRIDIAILAVQWAIVAVITGGLIVTLRNKEP